MAVHETRADLMHVLHVATHINVSDCHNPLGVRRDLLDACHSSDTAAEPHRYMSAAVIYQYMLHVNMLTSPEIVSLLDVIGQRLKDHIHTIGLGGDNEALCYWIGNILMLLWSMTSRDETQCEAVCIQCNSMDMI